MAGRTLLIWIILLVFTLIAGLVSRIASDYTVAIILTLSVLKFIGVAFEFMDLKTAHNFWKITVTGYLVVFVGIVLILL